VWFFYVYESSKSPFLIVVLCSEVMEVFVFHFSCFHSTLCLASCNLAVCSAIDHECERHKLVFSMNNVACAVLRACRSSQRLLCVEMAWNKCTLISGEVEVCSRLTNDFTST
jgi:hypothetical protein